MLIRGAVVEDVGGPFLLEELELAQPRPDEVLVRIVAAGICATDLHARDGHLPIGMPALLGHEGAGVVARVGSAVTTLEVGDHVVLCQASCGHCRFCLAGHGAYCEHGYELNLHGGRPDGSNPLTRPGADETRPAPLGAFFSQSSFATHALALETNAVKVRDDLPLEMLAPLGCGFTTGAGAVLNALDVRPGASIAVFGTGAVGLAAVMAARAAGAATIIGVDVVDSRLELAARLGATHTVNARDDDVVARVHEIAADGVDYVLEVTAIPSMVALATEVLAVGGTVGMVGTSRPGARLDLDPAVLFPGRSVRGIVQGDAVWKLFIPRLIELYRSGSFPFDELIRYYDLDQINQAVADTESGAVVKPVLCMGA